MPPDSSPPPPSTPSPPASEPAAESSPDSTPPASEGTIQAALDQVAIAFPTESSPLVELRLESFDSDTVFLTAVVNVDDDTSYDHSAVEASVADQFDSFGIPQDVYVSVRPLSTCLADPFTADDSSGDVSSPDSSPAAGAS
jgi:hypothetical protein